MKPVTVSVSDAATMTGLSKATLYRMMERQDASDGPRLEWLKIGTRRLIRVDSINALLGVA